MVSSAVVSAGVISATVISTMISTIVTPMGITPTMIVAVAPEGEAQSDCRIAVIRVTTVVIASVVS